MSAQTVDVLEALIESPDVSLQVLGAVKDLIRAGEAVIVGLSGPGAPTKTERNEMITILRAALTRCGVQS